MKPKEIMLWTKDINFYGFNVNKLSEQDIGEYVYKFLCESYGYYIDEFKWRFENNKQDIVCYDIKWTSADYGL